MVKCKTKLYGAHGARGSLLLLASVAFFAGGQVCADGIAQGSGQAMTVRSPPASAVKETVITAKVKARFAARHYGSLTTIRVNTDKDGIVWLSGTVSTLDASALAAQIAKDIEGVVAVHNAITVQ